MKKTRYFTSLAAVLLVLSACKKENAPVDWQEGAGELTVQLDKNTLKQREFLTFAFGGYADNLLIYDGTAGHEYRYRERTAMEGVKPRVSFTSHRQWGSQENSLAIKVSTDFTGDKYDADEINSATWTDITDRFVLSTGANNTPSGTVDLSDLVVPGKDMYFAFQYRGQAGTTQRQWTIRQFVIENELPIGTVQEVATTGTAGWKQYSFLNDQKIWTFNNNQMGIEGGNASSAENHDWLISKALDFTKVEPDQPSHTVKTRFQNMATSYRLGYAEPGSYVLTLIGKAADGRETKKEEYEITVNPNDN